jgi:hypothetical protein
MRLGRAPAGRPPSKRPHPPKSQQNPHLIVVWRPDVGSYTYTTLTKVDKSVPADSNLAATIIMDRERPQGWTANRGPSGSCADPSGSWRWRHAAVRHGQPQPLRPRGLPRGRTPSLDFNHTSGLRVPPVRTVQKELPVSAVLRAVQSDVRDDNGGAGIQLNDELGAWVSSLTIGRGWAGYPGGGYDTVPEAVGLTNRMQASRGGNDEGLVGVSKGGQGTGCFCCLGLMRVSSHHTLS